MNNEQECRRKNTATSILRYSVLDAGVRGQEAASGKQAAGLQVKGGKAKVSKALCNEFKNAINMEDQ